MPKIARQIEQMFEQLKSRDRITLLQRLEQKTWGERFHTLTRRIDKNRRRYPVSRKEVMNLVKQARRERYAGRS